MKATGPKLRALNTTARLETWLASHKQFSPEEFLHDFCGLSFVLLLQLTWRTTRFQIALLTTLAACATPLAAQMLSQCKGYGANGIYECKTTPQIIQPWQFTLPGPPRATPWLPSDQAVIDIRKQALEENVGSALCGSVSASVGPIDTSWGPYYAQFEYKTFLTSQRMPVIFDWTSRNGPPDMTCYPHSSGDYLYQRRQASCKTPEWSESWVDPISGFCFASVPPEDRSCTAGNPVQPGSGTKVASETDYSGAGFDQIGLTRNYRSRWAVGVAGGAIGFKPGSSSGAGWMHGFERGVHEMTFAPVPTQRVSRADGTVYTFVRRAGADGIPGWVAEAGLFDTLVELKDPGGMRTGWQYLARPDDAVETYSADGKLQSIRQRNGWLTTLSYSDAATPIASYVADGAAARPGLLIAVTNQFGRRLRFVYDGAGRIVQVLPPGALKDGATGGDQAPIRYAYDASGNLASVTWQDGSVKRYHYDDTRFTAHLTGITDELGVRIGTYAYDAQGRAISSEGAGGGERYTFQYNSSTQSRVTAPDGISRIYGFAVNNGVSRPTSVSAPCPLCGTTSQSTTYGDGAAANGGEGARSQPIKSVAHDGSVTFTSYDGKGRVTEKAIFPASFASNTGRPALSAATSVTSTAWHATWNLPIQTAEPGKLTAYTYNASGNLTGQSWTATTDGNGASAFGAIGTGAMQSTGWGYNTTHLPITVLQTTRDANSVDAVETGRWNLSYTATGDVSSTTDMQTGRVAQATQYDAHGRLVTGTSAAGAPIAATFTPRGLITRYSDGGLTMQFQWTAIGQLQRIDGPGSDLVIYEYDAAQRLIGVRKALTSVASIDSTLTRVARALRRAIELPITNAYAQIILPPITPVVGGAIGGFGQGRPPASIYPGDAPISAQSTDPNRELARRLGEKHRQVTR